MLPRVILISGWISLLGEILNWVRHVIYFSSMLSPLCLTETNLDLSILSCFYRQSSAEISCKYTLLQWICHDSVYLVFFISLSRLISISIICFSRIATYRLSNSFFRPSYCELNHLKLSANFSNLSRSDWANSSRSCIVVTYCLSVCK